MKLLLSREFRTRTSWSCQIIELNVNRLALERKGKISKKLEKCVDAFNVTWNEVDWQMNISKHLRTRRAIHKHLAPTHMHAFRSIPILECLFVVQFWCTIEHTLRSFHICHRLVKRFVFQSIEYSSSLSLWIYSILSSLSECPTKKRTNSIGKIQWHNLWNQL